MPKSRDYRIKMSEQGYKALEEIAALQQRTLASVIRQALEEYAKKQGRQATFDVEHGGNRRASPPADA